MLWIVSMVFASLVAVGIYYFGPRLYLANSSMSKIAALVLFGVWTGLHTLTVAVYQVPAGHVGVVYSFGAIVNQTSDGLQFVAPWRKVLNASIQVQGHKFDKLNSFSSETQDVFVASTVNVRVSPENIQSLYRDVGPNYFDILVRPRVLQNFKDETVKYKSVDIAPHREEIRKAVRERLTNELRAHSIIVEDLLLDNISFTGEFQNAIEEKQKQSQLALAEREKVAREQAKADQKIEEARGTAQSILINAEKQAEANRKLNASLTPELIQYTMIQKLSDKIEVMILPQGQNFILSPDMLRRGRQKQQQVKE